MTYEGLRLRINKINRKLLKNIRRKKLKNKDFTIISNNCWGGMIYESYGMMKNSPTVGLYFYSEDYIKFIKDLKNNLNSELKFIRPEESKWHNAIQDEKFGQYPIGILNNGIEIFFLHYHNEKEAKDKWTRRCKRVNYNNLLIKYNDQNLFDKKYLEEFCSLKYKNKLFFTVNKTSIKSSCIILIKKIFNKSDFILASYEPFGKTKYIDITQYLNNMKSENENE